MSVTTVPPDQVRRVGIVGAGVIGGGWALHFLRMGLDVDVYDPSPAARNDLLRMRAEIWPLLERMGLRDGASQDRLLLHNNLASAVSRADVIQENAPEDSVVKRRVLAEIDGAAQPDAVIASSTSGFGMTLLQADCARPARCVVGHPFNPPYLIPLVEVVGGERTDPAAVDWLVSFYAQVGKRPLRLTRELPGFVATRLQEAMWREALHMVAAGEASVEEIDESIAFGPGLRWAQMGPCLTFHLAGGAAGMSHMLDHFGAALLEPWTRLAAPALTAQLRERMVQGCEREAAGRSVAELERRRDDFLAELLVLLERFSVSPNSDMRQPAPGGSGPAAGAAQPAHAGAWAASSGSEPAAQLADKTLSAPAGRLSEPGSVDT
jgi:carnitine 3-dehydrogenase